MLCVRVGQPGTTRRPGADPVIASATHEGAKKAEPHGYLMKPVVSIYKHEMERRER